MFPVLRLPNARARAYLVQDHEPKFYASSTESVFAMRTYAEGLYCIAASPWLRDLVHTRYGAHGTAFELGVDPTIYHPRPVERRNDTIIFYAREVTPRRGVPIGILALDELRRRRPDSRFVLFGSHVPVETPFPHDHLGVATPDELAVAYSEATVGLSLSLTNYSLIPQEMMACGLPVVELAGRACEGVFGDDGSVISLADDSPMDVANHLLALLDDPAKREAQSAAGLAFAQANSWDAATATVVGALEKLHRDAAAPRAWAAGSLI